jgi:hypothetical protein
MNLEVWNQVQCGTFTNRSRLTHTRMRYHVGVQIKDTMQELVHNEFRLRFSKAAPVFVMRYDVGKEISDTQLHRTGPVSVPASWNHVNARFLVPHSTPYSERFKSNFFVPYPYHPKEHHSEFSQSKSPRFLRHSCSQHNSPPVYVLSPIPREGHTTGNYRRSD